MVAYDEDAGVKKIMVVDDNPDNLDIFIHRLRALGNFEILIASNGKQAVEVAERFRPNLVFMDVKMPIMDGYQATQALRETEWGKNLPIIAVTAYVPEEDRKKALSMGCSDFIPKPVLDYSVVRKAVERLLK